MTASESSYEARMRAALDRGATAEVERLALEAFEDPGANENELAWVAAAAYEKGLASDIKLLETFVRRFPGSLHLPRIYFASHLARQSRFDDATEHARHYLRCARDAGVFATLGSVRILREGVSQAFLLLTAAYTELGARSYSERVLRHALDFDLVPRLAAGIESELARLATEVQAPPNKAANDQWNAFLETGAGADALYKTCMDRGFPILAKRVDLLEGNFRFNAEFKVREAEMYMLVHSTADNAHLLA